MVIQTLVRSLDLFRRNAPSTPTASETYNKSVLTKVNLAQNTASWQLSNNGGTQKKSATLFFNVGISGQSPAMTPAFKEGDFIALTSNDTTPPEQKFVVQSVSEHYFKGVLHHYEVVLS